MDAFLKEDLQNECKTNNSFDMESFWRKEGSNGFSSYGTEWNEGYDAYKEKFSEEQRENFDLELQRLEENSSAVHYYY